MTNATNNDANLPETQECDYCGADTPAVLELNLMDADGTPGGGLCCMVCAVATVREAPEHGWTVTFRPVQK